jgi:O-antigen/teichoic acid export membrane protein
MSETTALPAEGASASSRSVSSRLVGQCGEPLFRNGHALNASAMIASAIGLGFWVLAAHRYPMAVVGRNSVAVLVLMFIGGAAQLNLASAFVCFLPGAGRRAASLVATSYAVSASVAVVLATGFLVLVPHLVPALDFLVADRWLGLWFVVSSAVWAVFVLEDGALTGLRRTPWVPVENGAFSILKAVLVVPLATVMSGAGIVVAWTVAAISTVIPTNWFLFGRAIPRHVRRSPPGFTVTLADLRRFVPYDYVGALCWLAATSLVPLAVIARVGAGTSASFSVAWIIAYSLYLVSINLGSSLVAETSTDPSALRRECRRVRVHLLKLLGPCVAVTVIGAPLLLRLMGSAYSAEGATLLRLLALSALPFIVTATAISAYRSRRHTRPVAVINAAVLTVVVVLSVLLLPIIGIAGVGVAWLVAQSAVALVLVMAEHRHVATLGASAHPVLAASALAALAASAFPGSARPTRRRTLAIRLLVPLARWSLPTRVVDQAGRLRWRRARAGARRLVLAALPELAAIVPSSHPGQGHRSGDPIHVLPSRSDRVVAVVQPSDDQPAAVVKVARSEQALVEFCAEQNALRALADDPRIGPWRSMLPEMYLVPTDNGTVALERLFEGTDAHRLIEAKPTLLPEVMRLGIQAIGELHRRTARPIAVDQATVDGWLGPALDVLRRIHPSGLVPRGQLEATDRLELQLHRALDGRQLDVSWVHGDYTPGNVMLGWDASTVHGILDWGQGRPDAFPDLDVVLWLAALECQVRRWSMGRFVGAVLAAPVWRTSTLLQISRAEMTPFDIGHHELVLWCWLEHVTGNLRKAERYERHTWWWAANVEPVLRALVA